MSSEINNFKCEKENNIIIIEFCDNLEFKIFDK